MLLTNDDCRLVLLVVLFPIELMLCGLSRPKLILNYTLEIELEFQSFAAFFS